MPYTRHIVFGIGVLSFGYFGLGTQINALSVPKERRGNLLRRMQEVSKATFISCKIQNDYTSQRHVEVVQGISSKKFAETGNKLLYSSYEEEILKKNPYKETPVFSYESEKMIRFSGPLNGIHSASAREHIMDGNYFRCPAAILVDVPPASEIPVDALLTGTKNGKCCSELIEALFYARIQEPVS